MIIGDSFWGVFWKVVFGRVISVIALVWKYIKRFYRRHFWKIDNVRLEYDRNKKKLSVRFTIKNTDEIIDSAELIFGNREPSVDLRKVDVVINSTNPYITDYCFGPYSDGRFFADELENNKKIKIILSVKMNGKKYQQKINRKNYRSSMDAAELYDKTIFKN